MKHHFNDDIFRLRPLEALDAVRRLMRDKDNTTHVFRILKSLGGRSVQREFGRFCSQPFGEAILTNPVQLTDILCNRQYLQNLPEDSLGRAYLAFMIRCGLTPEGLNTASQDAGIDDASLDADYLKYELRLRCSHDLWHVVSGYGCDGLGEVCLVAFSYRHTRNLGFMLIAIAGAYHYQKQFPGKPIWRAMWEGYKRGGKATWLVMADWERLLSQPLNQVQRELNIQKAPYYVGIPDVIEATMTASPHVTQAVA